jgi:hypothetical protein
MVIKRTNFINFFLAYLTVLSVSTLRCPELPYEKLYDSYISLKFVKVIKDGGDKKKVFGICG